MNRVQRPREQPRGLNAARGFALMLESSMCAVETFPTPMCVVYSVVWFVYTVCKSPLKREKKAAVIVTVHVQAEKAMMTRHAATMQTG